MTLDDSRAHDARTSQALTFKIAIDAPLKSITAVVRFSYGKRTSAPRITR
jgi:hypothetical protein